MVNLTWGAHTSVGINPPDGSLSAGTSMEWIVEATRSQLPMFYSVEFNYCSAATQSQTETTMFQLTSGGTPVTIVGGSGNPLTDAEIESPSRAVVRWLGFD